MKLNNTTQVVRRKAGLAITAIALGFMMSCSSESSSSDEQDDAVKSESSPSSNDPMASKGIGPVSSVALGQIDQKLVDEGKTIFETNCTACHKFDQRYVGPALQGVTTRRSPEWIMNMILNPAEMTQQDPVAKELLATYLAQMANQNLTEEQARAVLEYFRSIDGGI